MTRPGLAPLPHAEGAGCECQGTGAVIVGTEAVACTCPAADYEWAAKLNRARVLKAQRPVVRRGMYVRDYPRSSEDAES